MAASCSSDSLRQRLYEVLRGSSVAGPDFCCHGALRSRMEPCLEVQGLGRITLPLDEQSAAVLKAVCTRARGEQTVTDTGVRHTWQLEPGQFALANPRTWVLCLGGVLGCTACKQQR